MSYAGECRPAEGLQQNPSVKHISPPLRADLEEIDRPNVGIDPSDWRTLTIVIFSRGLVALIAYSLSRRAVSDPRGHLPISHPQDLQGRVPAELSAHLQDILREQAFVHLSDPKGQAS